MKLVPDGTVHIYASKEAGLLRAKDMIERMFQEIEVNKVYTGKVVSITAFGAFMEVLPGKDGLTSRTSSKRATSSLPSASGSMKKAASK
ncbi:MAG: hypothetical protein NTW21_18000 [Verrucomicrobia bacterium]|nr:hypothetical protein [Verrucomicrobiota bacterium]